MLQQLQSEIRPTPHVYGMFSMNEERTNQYQARLTRGRLRRIRRP
jgi:hypothetical protein